MVVLRQRITPTLGSMRRCYGAETQVSVDPWVLSSEWSRRPGGAPDQPLACSGFPEFAPPDDAGGERADSALTSEIVPLRRSAGRVVECEVHRETFL